MLRRVVITDCLSPPADIEENILEGLATVACLEAKRDADLDGRLLEADAVIVYHEVALSESVLDEMTRCRLIVRGGAGYDNVDIRAAGARGMAVSNVPDYGVDEVADHAIALMLGGLRGLIKAERSLRSASPVAAWDRHAVAPVPRLAELTLGIIGCGRIGAATALRARALKMRVLACDPYLCPGMEKVFSVERVSFEEILTRSDVISVHTPLTDETHHLIDAAALGRMKTGAFLVNTARGAVVDTAALAAALEGRQLAGAGIDVLPDEPPSADDPLVKLWRAERDPPINLIVTPHTAYYSEAGLAEIRRKSSEEIARFFRGERLWNCVNERWLTDCEASRSRQLDQ